MDGTTTRITSAAIASAVDALQQTYNRWVRDIADRLYDEVDADELTDDHVRVLLDDDGWCDAYDAGTIAALQYNVSEEEFEARIRDVRASFDACVRARG